MLHVAKQTVSNTSFKGQGYTMLESKFWNEKPTMTAYCGTTSARCHHLQIINSPSNISIFMFTMIKEI